MQSDLTSLPQSAWSDVPAHEQAEEQRIEAARVEASAQEAALLRDHDDAMKKEQQAARTKTDEVMQHFEASESAAILMTAKERAASELAEINSQAAKGTPALVKSLTEHIISGELTLA